MIRLGCIALALSMAALWAVPLSPQVIEPYLRPLSVGMLTTGLALLLLAVEPHCPRCGAERLSLFPWRRTPAGPARSRHAAHEPPAVLVEDVHDTATPPGVPIVNEHGDELDEDEADELLDELDDVVTTDPGPLRVPAYVDLDAWHPGTDPETTAPLPRVP